jgi:hypothetical protein
VVPKQHWVDGIATTLGAIKQFVATTTAREGA